VNRTAVVQNNNFESFSLQTSGILQRKCASCSSKTTAEDECTECANKNGKLQRKLSIGSSNDPLEHEADRIADQVMNIKPNSGVTSTVPKIQRASISSASSDANVPASVNRVLSNSGRPMKSGLRQDMEQRFGRDFSQVRIHTGNVANQSTRDVNARAFTMGNHVVFGASEFAPNTNSGKRLLAHELTHIVQQSRGKEKNIQRDTLENDPSTAPPMSCPLATSSPAGVSMEVIFGVNSDILDVLGQAAVSNFVGNWHLAAVAEPVRVDGFASIEGPPSLNWPLSCRRAESLKQELISPSDGSPGISGGSITLFAQGETNQFSPSLAPNRRAQAHIPAVPLVPPTVTSETVETSPGVRTRTDIGVGEEVDLTHSVGSVTWTTSGGTLSATTGTTVRLTAPDTAQSVTVSGGGVNKIFSVKAPISVAMDREPGTSVKHIVNRPNSGIQTRVFLGPDTVNFVNVRYRELDVPGVVTSPGVYSCNPASSGHCAGAVGGACPDKAMSRSVVSSMGTKSVLGDCAYSGSCPTTAPFVSGSLTLTIPYEYKVGSGSFRSIINVTQLHRLAPDASTLTTSKAGASGTTIVTAATTTIAQCP